jgi:hypothetical protein
MFEPYSPPFQAGWLRDKEKAAKQPQLAQTGRLPSSTNKLERFASICLPTAPSAPFKGGYATFS